MFSRTCRGLDAVGTSFTPKSCIFCHHVSTASAIQRGIRRSRPSSPIRLPDLRAENLGGSKPAWGNLKETDTAKKKRTSSSSFTISGKKEKSFVRSRSQDGSRGASAASPLRSSTSSGYLPRVDGEPISVAHSRSRRFKAPDEFKTAHAPTAIPYTTPASEFLYGTSVVEAALMFKRRNMYKLYLLTADEGQATRPHDKLARLASQAGVRVERVSGGAWMSLLDRMSHGRPHNGCCLEASPIKRPLIGGLLAPKASPDDGNVRLVLHLEAMSEEDRKVNGSDDEIAIIARLQRQPFVLLLDGITDTGNLGGILRSAYFLGADAVVLSGTCAPLNPVVLKASAGAAEALPLLMVNNTTGFVQRSRAAGWKTYASVAPPRDTPLSKTRRVGERNRQKHIFLDSFHSPLAESPALLMLGGEGTGLKADLQNKADFAISIRGNRIADSTVDSLNVSVATGILVDKFLQIPRATSSSTVAGLW